MRDENRLIFPSVILCIRFFTGKDIRANLEFMLTELYHFPTLCSEIILCCDQQTPKDLSDSFANSMSYPMSY